MNPWEKAEKKKQATPAVVDIKPEPEPMPEPEQKPTHTEERTQTTQVLVSNTDAYIHDRMKGQPKSLQDIDVEIVTERQPGLHRLSLPKELEPYKDKYTFRWIYKNKRAIDEACDVKGWVLANRSYFPELPNHLFTTNGSIERGDNVLTFMSRKKAEALRQQPVDRAKQILNSTFEKHKDDPRYYVPKDEETGDRVVGI